MSATPEFAGEPIDFSLGLMSIGVDDQYDVVTTFGWSVHARWYTKSVKREAMPTFEAAIKRLNEVVEIVLKEKA
jgi:hypothetical protein